MTLPLTIHRLTDVTAAFVVIIITCLGFLEARRLRRSVPGSLFFRYIYYQMIALFVFASGRAVGHILKRLLLIGGRDDLWQMISPLSGGVNTLTFIAFSVLALLYAGMEEAERDLGEIKRESEEVKALLEYKQAIFDSMLFPAMVVDADYRVTDLNRAFEKLCGKERETVIGMRCHEVSHGNPVPCDTEDHPCPISLLKEGKESVRLIHRHKGYGEDRIVELTATPVFGPGGEITGMIEVQRDITDDLRAEEERDALRKRLLEVQKAESLRTLVGGIAHEFNNMLVGVQGNAEILLLRGKDRDEDDRKRLEKIMNAALKMADLIKRMMLYERSTCFEKIPTDMNDILHDALTLSRGSFTQKMELVTSFHDGPLPVLGDRPSLFQSVINLLTNARDAMPGGGRIKVSSGIAEREGRGYAVVSVEDEGGGMEEGVLERIFDPFFTTKDVGKGTGMGLSVVKGVVEAHNGLVEVDPGPGRGARFSILIPLRELSSRKKSLQ